MANQITHIVLAKKMSDKLFDTFDRKAFLIGTVFPDIRYLRVIDREKTHFHGLTFQDILNEEKAFTAGMKYHSLVDEVREKYMVEKKMYDIIPTSKYITQALKTYEDEVLYGNVSDWSNVVEYLGSVLPEEEGFVGESDKIKKWHASMQAYFADVPNDHSRKNFILDVGFPDEIAVEINRLIDVMRQVPEVRDIILGMYENWEGLVMM